MFIDPSTFSHDTGPVLGAAIEVHRTLGPGLLESIYMQCLQFELAQRKLRFVAQRAIPISYKGMALDACYRVDLIVEDLVVVEVKSIAALAPVHEAPLMTYLRITRCPAGLLINFNVPRLMMASRGRSIPRALSLRMMNLQGLNRGTLPSVFLSLRVETVSSVRLRPRPLSPVAHQHHALHVRLRVRREQRSQLEVRGVEVAHLAETS